MNVLSIAKRNVGSFAKKHPLVVGGGGGIALGIAMTSIIWYIYSNKNRRNKFKQYITNNASLIITPTNVALFAVAVTNQESRKQTVKTLLLIGAILNTTIIFVFIAKQLYNQKLKNKNSKNKIYPSPKSGSLYIRNPLILLIGISKYNKEKCRQFNIESTLEGVEIDIDNLTNLFKEIYKYQHVYTIQDYIENDDDYTLNYDGWEATDEIIQSFCQHYSNRKTIIELNKENKNKRDIDSLIVYYSGHGFENDWIYCSNGKLLSLYEIKNYFNEEKCDKFKRKPKLFYLDCCREQIFDKFTTKQNKDIKSRGCGALDSFNSKEQVTHNATNMYTFYATTNLKRTEEHSKDGGYMTNCFVKHLEEAYNNNNNTINELAQRMKFHLHDKNDHIGEEKNCLLNDNINFSTCI